MNPNNRKPDSPDEVCRHCQKTMSERQWWNCVTPSGHEFMEPSTPSQGEPTEPDELEQTYWHRMEHQDDDLKGVEPKEAQTFDWPEELVSDAFLDLRCEHRLLACGSNKIARELQAYRELKKRSEGGC